MNTKIFLIAAIIITIGVTGLFQPLSAQQNGYQMFDDVEALLDNPAEFVGKQVSVPGEVEYLIDQQTFVLESGGIINDEVVVFIPEEFPKEQLPLVVDDAELVVKGILRAFNVIEFEREIDWWDWTPEIEAELERVELVLVAEDITSK